MLQRIGKTQPSLDWLIGVSFVSSVNYAARHQSTDPSQTHPRRGGGHIILQIQAVLQRNTREIHLHR